MIAWFARNGVAANLLMLLLVAGGCFSLWTMKMELFPSFSLDRISVSVPYPGATPAEVEETICKRIEEKIQDLDGIKELTSIATENLGVVNVEVKRSYDISTLQDKIRNRVNSIQTFPELAEKPTIEELVAQKEILSLAIHGPADRATLKEIAMRVRDELVLIPGITQVDAQVTPYEISIEIPENKLREHNLRFEQVLMAVRQHSVDLSGGTLENETGKMLLRTIGQADDREQFEDIPILQYPDGSRLLLSDIAIVKDDLADVRVEAEFQGEPAEFLSVKEVGSQSPLDISKKVRQYIKDHSVSLPEGITITAWSDTSFYLEGRLNMLKQNGFVGLLLVLLILTLFLRPSLALFVSIGIPISFLGTFFIMPVLGMTINLISLFAFILVLGIVVDDAIVVGESVFTEFQKNGPGVKSAIIGSEKVSVPVTFAVLTSTVAFVPIFFIPGFQGKFLIPIPVIVIPTLLFSLVQSKLVLPYHLSLCKVGFGTREKLNPLLKVQRIVADGLEHVIDAIYRPILKFCLRNRYSILLSFISIFVITISFIWFGYVRVVPFPPVPSDYIFVTLKMQDGTSFETTEKATQQIQDGLSRLRKELKSEGHGDPFKHIFRITGASPFGGGGPMNVITGPSDTHYGQMIVELNKSEERDLSAPKLAARWRKAMGEIPGAKTLEFKATAAGRDGKPIEIELAGKDYKQLTAASEDVKDFLRAFPSVFSIFDSHPSGKQEIQLQLKPEAQTLGITQGDLARQVRYAFYGAEAQRIQRDREDIRVMIRYPKNERATLANLENLLIRTPDGREMPFHEVANASLGEGYSTIKRLHRKRTITVSADLDKSVGDLKEINDEVTDNLVPQLKTKYPGILVNIEGEAREAQEGNQVLMSAFLLSMLVMYALMAIPFRSYIQPLIIMSVIPFGLVGAVMGHWILGHPLSQLSIYGIIALAGIVVNDSLVLVDYINKCKNEGGNLHDIIRHAGGARFRPILLTTLTTFVGLTPILLETSLQAQFLIPMAISLSFGVLFATFITLILVPSMYLILEDIQKGIRYIIDWMLYKDQSKNS